MKLPPTPCPRNLAFVTAVSDIAVLQQRLCSSPCVQRGGWPLIAHFNAASAGHVFNAAMAGTEADAATWVVWVHQDVVLPQGWDKRFLDAIGRAQSSLEKLAVVGVYGLAGSERAGHVLHRGELLREPKALPCAADSLDELLFAVRADTGLRLDPALGFDFYATDLVLQAQAAGWQAAVVDAYCEHWSATPSSGPAIPDAVAQRVLRNAAVFEAKWEHRFPIHTSWVSIGARGDTERFVRELRGA